MCRDSVKRWAWKEDYLYSLQSHAEPNWIKMEETPGTIPDYKRFRSLKRTDMLRSAWKQKQRLGAGHAAALKYVRRCDLIKQTTKKTNRADRWVLIWDGRKTFVVLELWNSNGVQADWCCSGAGVSLRVKEQCTGRNFISSANTWLAVWNCWEIHGASLVGQLTLQPPPRWS